MKNLKIVSNKIKKAREIIITSHINPDGDAIGSMISLGIGLETLNKKVRLICKSDIPKIFSLLPGIKKIHKNAGIYFKKKYDVAIAVDCTTIDILAMDRPVLDNTKNIIEIDHHEYRRPFGTISLIDKNAAANGEIIFKLLKDLKVKISSDIAVNILTSIIIETNSFRLPSVKHETFKICADLLKTGVNFTKITNMVYWTQTKESAVLTGICLSRCKFLNNGRIIWSQINQEDFKEINGSDADVDAVPDLMRSIKTVEIAVLLREKDAQILRVSMRSKGNYNIAEIAKIYGGAGHYDTAGCFIPNNKQSIDELLEKLVFEINR